MMKESQQLVRSPTQASKASIQVATNFSHIGWHKIAKPPFDVPMTVFFGIHLGCIRRQFFQIQTRMFSHIGLNQFGAMRARLIPNDYQRSPNLAAKVFQSGHNLFSVDRFGKVAFVDFA